MSSYLKKGKKALSVGVTVTTIVWTLGLAAVAPVTQAQTLQAGDLLQCDAKDKECPKDRALYWFTSDGKRLTFPNEKTYKTWHKDFKSVTVKQLSLAELGAVKMAGNVTYRPGTRLAKITTDPSTYVVTPGGALRHIPSEAAAKMLFGGMWAKWIDDVPDVFFQNYTVGAPLKEGEWPDGMLLKEAGKDTVYLVAGGKKREFADANALTANGYMADYIVTTSKENLDKLSMGDKVTGMDASLRYPFAAAAAAAEKKAEAVVPGTLEVGLGAESPTAGTLVPGQSGAQLLQLKFTNKGTAPMTLTSLKLKRTGVTADTTLPAIYLYQGASRLTDSATVSQTYATFNQDVTLPVGTSTLWAVANIAAGTAGATVGLSLEAANHVKTRAGDTVTGTFPVNGAVLSVGSATLAGVDFNNTTLPAAANINPLDGFTAWQNTVSITTRDVWLKRFALKLVGSISSADVMNFRLQVDGVAAGKPVEKLDANNFVTFDLSSAPMTLKPGNRVFKMLADVKGGTSRTMSFQLRDAADALLLDSEVANGTVGILPTANAGTFSARSTGDQTINAGAVTVTKTSDSPSGTVVNSSSGQPLARYEFVATGENIKVESLTVGILVSGANSNTITLRNGALYVKQEGDTDWRPVGSTANLTAAAAGTQYNLGGSMVVDPKKKMWLEVRADIFDNTGANELAANTTLFVRLLAGNANGTRQVTGTTLNAPTGNVDGNTLTVNVGSATLTRDQAFGNQTYVVPKQTSLLGKWTLKNAGDTEDLTLNTFYLDMSAAVDALDASADLTQVYLKYGTKTVSPRSTVSLTALANSWSVSETLKKGESMTVEAYGDLASGSTDGDGTADTLTTSLRVDVTATGSSTSSNTGTVAGQTVTATGSGTLTVSLDTTSPVAALAVAGTTSDNGALKVRLAATNEDMYVKDLRFRATAQAQDAAVASATLWKSSSSTGPWTQVGTQETFDADGATNPGFVRWTLSGDQRVKVAKDATVYLLIKPTFVSSQQAAVTSLAPAFMLVDLDADGSTGVLTAGGNGTDAVNSTGIIARSNSSATYVTSTETLAAAVASATTQTLTSANGVAFTAGDLIFVDENADTTWDPATEELMAVLADAGAALTVERGVYGTTAQAAYTNGRTLFRLDNASATRGIVGSAITVMNTTLTLATTGSPSGASTGGTSKEVFRIVASAAANTADQAENTATLTRVDLTVNKSAATVTNLVLYPIAPQNFDNNATYQTTCSALSTTKWRCTLSTAGASNEISEGSSRTYTARANVGYSGQGSVEFSIANLGTSNSATNDVNWTDAASAGGTSMTWVYQTGTQLLGGAQTTTAASGTADATAPTITGIVITDATADNALTVGATIAITFSEMMDPTTIGNKTPGAATSAVTDAATADIAGVDDGTVDRIRITGIIDIGLGNTTALTAAATGAVNAALNSAGTVLTLTVTTALTLNAADGGETVVAGTAATTMTDANGVAATAAGSNAATLAALDL